MKQSSIPFDHSPLAMNELEKGLRAVFIKVKKSECLACGSCLLGGWRSQFGCEISQSGLAVRFP